MSILRVLGVLDWKKWVLGIVGGLILAGLVFLAVKPHFNPVPTTEQRADNITNNTWNTSPRFGCARVQIYDKVPIENNTTDKAADLK